MNLNEAREQSAPDLSMAPGADLAALPLAWRTAEASALAGPLAIQLARCPPRRVCRHRS